MITLKHKMPRLHVILSLLYILSTHDIIHASLFPNDISDTLSSGNTGHSIEQFSSISPRLQYNESKYRDKLLELLFLLSGTPNSVNKIPKVRSNLSKYLNQRQSNQTDQQDYQQLRAEDSLSETSLNNSKLKNLLQDASNSYRKRADRYDKKSSFISGEVSPTVINKQIMRKRAIKDDEFTSSLHEKSAKINLLKDKLSSIIANEKLTESGGKVDIPHLSISYPLDLLRELLSVEIAKGMLEENRDRMKHNIDLFNKFG